LRAVGLLLVTAAPLVTACSSRIGDAPSEPASAELRRIDGESIVRGITIGPIENGLHPGVGYGSSAYARQLDNCVRMGATWVSITPFGRVFDLSGVGVDPTFETPYELNFPRVLTAIRMAHARGLKVFLVPHLWVESGDWRGLIDPKTEVGWNAWAASYESFIRGWARVAEAEGAEMFSAGVELRSWVTSGHATSFENVIASIRKDYHGLLTYSANWDDAVDTVVWGDLDVIAVNAFFPLANHTGASWDELVEGATQVRERVHALADTWEKPVLFAEIGYTTRRDPAIHPWEWPDSMTEVVVDEHAQADAFRALLLPLVDEPSFAGFFVWRVFSDPDDVSQESEWGFSPEGKLAELVIRDAFAARWVGESRDPGRAATVPGVYP
jgi:hypothetical protein